MFGVGNTEFLIICFVALLLFGNRLPSVMRSLGSGLHEFKKGVDNVQDDVKKKIDESGKG